MADELSITFNTKVSPAAIKEVKERSNAPILACKDALLVTNGDDQVSSKFGERILIRRFVRWELGEGIQKEEAKPYGQEIAELSGLVLDNPGYKYGAPL